MDKDCCGQNGEQSYLMEELAFSKVDNQAALIRAVEYMRRRIRIVRGHFLVSHTNSPWSSFNWYTLVLMCLQNTQNESKLTESNLILVLPLPRSITQCRLYLQQTASPDSTPHPNNVHKYSIQKCWYERYLKTHNMPFWTTYHTATSDVSRVRLFCSGWYPDEPLSALIGLMH